MEEVWTAVEPRIQEALDRLASERRSDYKHTPLYGTAIALALAGLGSMMFGFSVLLLLVCLVVGWVIVALIYYSQHNEQYKAKVMPALVDAVCPGASYSAVGTLNKEMIKSSELYSVGFGEHFENEDTIRGVVGKTDFVYGEVELWHLQSTGKSAVKVTDFKGFVFEADFNKYFQGITILSSERFRLAGHVGFFSNLERCKLEDVRFEEKFRTYTTNDQEARYLLTPALQERIMEMNRMFYTELGDDKLSISFHHDRMLIMVPSRTNRFEVKYDLASVRKDFIALRVMIEIVEQLNLNLRIWTKE